MSSISIEGTPVNSSSSGGSGSGDLSVSGHLLLIYKDDGGHEFVIRGGPTSAGPSYGPLTVEINQPIEFSVDARVDGSGNPVTPESRGHIEISLGDRSAEDVWNLLIQQAQNIDAHHFAYGPLGFNSNGTAADLLGLVGVDVDGYLPHLPGGMIFSYQGKDVAFNFDYSIIGTSSDDVIVGRAGKQIFTGGGGNDSLDGGASTDTAVFSGRAGDYNIVRNADKTWTVDEVRGDGADGRDALANFELIKFADGQTFNLVANGIKSQSDFVFVVDTTGSMGPYIGAVKTQANAIIEKLYGTTDNPLDAHVGIVGFKDPGDITAVLPFTTHDDLADRKLAALNAISGISTSLGGDIPEGDYSALLYALQGHLGEWRDTAASRKLVLFTDAPAKDFYLAPIVAIYAHNLGVTITESSVEPTALGVAASFTLSTAAADDTPAESFTVQIYTIQVGYDLAATPDLEAIAGENGGQFFYAGNPEALTEAILKIIDIPPPGLNETPVANPDTASVGENQSASFDVLGNDSDPNAGDLISLLSISSPSVASTNPDVNGIDASTAFLVDGDQIRFEPGNLFDRLSVGETAEAIVTYTIEDQNDAQASSTLEVTIIGENNNPIAVDDIAGGGILQRINVPGAKGVLSNDTDIDHGDHLTVSEVNGKAVDGSVAIRGELGTLVMNADGGFSYSADWRALLTQGRVAQDHFTYTSSDGYGGSSSATLVVTLAWLDQKYVGGTSGSDILSATKWKSVLDGGSGDDTLNGSPKNDVLIGGEGNDLMTGGKGHDLFVFSGAFENDRVLDFKAREDQLQFDKDTFHDFADLKAHATQVGTSVVISSVEFGNVTLDNVILAQLHANNFSFVSEAHGDWLI